MNGLFIEPSPSCSWTAWFVYSPRTHTHTIAPKYGLIASKYGIKLSTNLGLRLLLYLGRQKVSITPKPFTSLPPVVPRQTPLPRWLIQRRVAPRRSFPPLATLQKWPSSPGWTKKETEVIKGVAPDATKPPTAPQDPAKDKEAPRMKIVLASLPIPTKGDPIGTDQGSSEATIQQSKAPPQGEIVIKKK